jgi:hypothetical protein
LFDGIKYMGEGFQLTPTQASILIAESPHNREVIQPFFDSDSVVDFADHHSDRWIINFGSRTEQEASTYKAPFRIVRTVVAIRREKSWPDCRTHTDDPCVCHRSAFEAPTLGPPAFPRSVWASTQTLASRHVGGVFNPSEFIARGMGSKVLRCS